MRKSQFVALGLAALCTTASAHGLERTVVTENSLQFRINEFRRSLKKVNSSCYEVKANRLTLGLNIGTRAT